MWKMIPSGHTMCAIPQEIGESQLRWFIHQHFLTKYYNISMISVAIYTLTFWREYYNNCLCLITTKHHFLGNSWGYNGATKVWWDLFTFFNMRTLCYSIPSK